MIRGVQIILLSQDNQILIAKRTPLKKDGTPRIGANRWNFIGGKIDPDETPLQSAIREVKEESGLDIKDMILVSEKENPWDTNYDPFYVYLFVAKIPKNQKIILNPEHSEYELIDIEKIESDFNLLGYSQNEIQEALQSYKEKLEELNSINLLLFTSIMISFLIGIELTISSILFFIKEEFRLYDIVYFTLSSFILYKLYNKTAKFIRKSYGK